MEHAHAFEPIRAGRIYIEKLNGRFLFGDKGTPTEYSAGLKLAIERGWLIIRDSGTYVKPAAASTKVSPRRGRPPLNVANSKNHTSRSIRGRVRRSFGRESYCNPSQPSAPASPDRLPSTEGSKNALSPATLPLLSP